MRQPVPPQDTSGIAYASAEQRVEQRVGLAVHWPAFVIVNTALVVLVGGFDGAGWRLAGWGLGLALHSVYVLAHLDGLKHRLVRREVERTAAWVQ